jgi:hypothetical protein
VLSDFKNSKSKKILQACKSVTIISSPSHYGCDSTSNMDRIDKQDLVYLLITKSSELFAPTAKNLAMN